MDEYGIKYQIQYLRRRGTQTTINILEKNYSGGITQLQAAGTPLEISYTGDETNIYTPSVGSGVTIQIMATPLSLQEFFTTDPQQFKVMIYEGDSEDSSGGLENENLFWQGFINTGIYTESYSYPLTLLAPITIYCNDGLSILDELPYTNGIGGSNYTGIESIGTVMQRIFAKINLEFLYIRKFNDLLVSASDYDTILTGVYVNNANYYDEKDEPMSCREVLDSICEGLGMVLSLKGTTIYMVDPINLGSTGKMYNTHPTWGTPHVPGTIAMGGPLDISNGDINWYETGQQIDLITPFDYINIKYDPYTFCEVGYDFNDTENITDPETFGEYGDSEEGLIYRIFHDIDMLGWTTTVSDKFTAIQQIYPDSENKMYIIRQEPGGSGYYEYTFPNSYINKDDNIYLELSMNVYINTRDYGNIWDPAAAHTVIPWTWLNNFKLKIGNKWFQSTYGAPGGWEDTEGTFLFGQIREINAEIIPSRYIHGTWFRKPKYYMPVDTSDVGDKWVQVYMYIPLPESESDLNGQITLRIPKEMDAVNDDAFQNILIKDINIAITNLTKDTVVNDGILTNGVIDSSATLKKSGLDIELKHGIGLYGSSKGAFINNYAGGNGVLLSGFHRSGGSDYTSAKLLLQNLLSQYGAQRFKITGKLDVKSSIYYNIPTLMMVLIQDTNHLSTKRFHIINGTYNDREEYLEGTFIELVSSRQTIT
jgi:hypothetical protein